MQFVVLPLTLDSFIIVPMTVFLFQEPFSEAAFGSSLRNRQSSIGSTEGGGRRRRPSPRSLQVRTVYSVVRAQIPLPKGAPERLKRRGTSINYSLVIRIQRMVIM